MLLGSGVLLLGCVLFLGRRHRADRERERVLLRDESAGLATVQLDAERRHIEQIASLQGRILAATAEEVASAVDVVETALTHPLMERARRAARRGQCRREVPVSLREASGLLIEGVVDLAFLEDGGWTVIDFKTDRELQKELEAYRQQVRLYASALSAATGQNTAAVLMRV